MKWAAVFMGLLTMVAGSGCWRPYYGQMYAQPAYPSAPVYQQPVAAAPMVQQAAPVQYVQQPCQPVVCPPNPCCTPY
jgi:hypothetical protein